MRHDLEMTPLCQRLDVELWAGHGQALEGALDYARREPVATRGRAFSIATICCLTGSATGTLFIGIFMNTAECSP